MMTSVAIVVLSTVGSFVIGILITSLILLIDD